MPAASERWTAEAAGPGHPAWSGFDVASARAGTEERTLLVGDVAVRLRVAGGPLLAALWPALAHLAAQVDSIDVDLRAWDSASAGIAAPTPFRGSELGEVHGLVDGVRYVQHRPPGHAGTCCLSAYDSAAAAGVWWTASPDGVPWWERAAPLRTLFHLALSGPRRLLVHAAAIGRGAFGALLVGAGGSGKSTTALAALLSGLDYVGDDYVLLDVAVEPPVAHALYGLAKLVPGTEALLPGFDRTAIVGSPLASGFAPDAAKDAKAVVDVERLAPSGLRRRVPVTAVVACRRGGGRRSRLRPATATEALLALAPSTVFQLPGNGIALGALADLVRGVPCYVLELGPDPAEAVDLLARTLLR